jgi:PAS domain S-box-containing protein
MFKRVKIRTKILLAFTVIAIVTVVTIAFVSFRIGQTALERESFNKLTAVREMKANQIEDYFQLISSQLHTQSNDRMIIEAMRDFSQGYQDIEGETPLSVGMLPALDELYREEFLERLIPNLLREVTVEEYLPQSNEAAILQNLYISSNPFETGSKHLLDTANDGSSYSAAHELYHPIIRDFLEHFGYYDIFLVDPKGNIVYSVFKEVDFGTSLTDGPYSDTNFARAFRAALNAEDTDTVIVEDFEPYHPSYNAPASFMATPIIDGGEKIGVLVFQMPIDRINYIMTNDQNWAEVGLGDSGETYLVGPDYLLRNQSRFLIEDSDNYFKAIDEIGVPLATMGQIRNLNSTIGLQEVDTEGTRAALAGETSTDIFPDYRGVSVLSAYKPLEISGLNWVIMSEIDEAEAFASIRSLGLRLGIASLGLIAFIIIAAFFFSRTLTRPLVELTNDAEMLSYGVLDLEIGNMDSKDEIGDLARNFDVMRLSLKKLIDDLALLNKDLENKVIERTAELEASERQSNSIIELSSDAIIVIDEHGEVLVWNARAEELFGYSRENMIGSPMDQIIPGRHKSGHDKAFAQATKNHKLKAPGATHELTATNKHGQEIPVELSLAHWKLGGKSYFSASIRDITERKQAEQAIRDSEERIRSIVEIAPDAIISIDGEQNIVMFNTKAEEIFGYSVDEVLGLPVTMLMREESHNVHPSEVNKFRNQSHTSRSMDNRRGIFGRRKDGTIFPAEAGISKLKLDEQIIFTAFFRDITKRVEMEQAVRESESRFRSLFEDSPTSLWEEDFSGAKRYIDDLLYSGVDDLSQYFAQNPASISEIASLVKIIRVNQATLDLYHAANEEELYGNLNQVFSEHSLPYFTAQTLALASGATSYQGETINQKIDGELFDCIVDVSIAPDYEDNWAKVFVSITDITERKRLEAQIAIANERMSTELNFARDIQISMLPLIFPAFPDRKEVAIHAALDSAREVGGDFYDFYFLNDDHLCFVVGDVSGKGAPGALMMAVSKTLIKSRAADDDEPASILTHVNNELSQDNASSMFVTVFLGILNVKTGEFVYTNAGHNPPYIRRKDGAIQKVDAFHGPVIGAMPGMPYDHDREKLDEGDVILVYSDGVPEAFNEDEQAYGELRLETLLASRNLNSAEAVVIHTLEDVKLFVGEAEQSDDITLLAVEFLETPEVANTQQLELIIKNRIEEMAVVDQQFSAFAAENDLPDATRQSVSIALDEMLNNIISHAYKGEKEKEIEVGIALSGNRLVVTIKDTGAPFNPFARKSPDISASIGEREVGGLGIHMVRNLMDEVSYQRQINKNVVTLVKLLSE